MVADFAQHSSYDWKARDSVGMVLALRRIMATLLVSATHYTYKNAAEGACALLGRFNSACVFKDASPRGAEGSDSLSYNDSQRVISL